MLRARCRRHVQEVDAGPSLVGRVQQAAVPAVLAAEITHYEATYGAGGLELGREVEEMLILFHRQLHERDEELIVDGEELNVMLLEEIGGELVQVELEVAELVHAAHQFGRARWPVRKEV